MRLYWNQLRAMVWKAWREAWPIWLLTLAVALVTPFLFISSKPHGIQHDDAINFQFLIGVNLSYILAAAFMLFLPILSREPERGLLNCIRVKPISPEWYGIMQWLSALTLAVIGLIAAWFSSLLWLPWFGMGYAFVLLFMLLALASLCIYLISSLTGNRLRSFGLFLLAAPTVMMAGGWIDELRALPNEAYFGLVGLIERCSYFFGVNMPLALFFVTVIIAALALFAVRVRLSARLRGWAAYTGTIAASALLFFIFMQLNTSTINARIAPMDMSENSDDVNWALGTYVPTAQGGWYTRYARDYPYGASVHGDYTHGIFMNESQRPWRMRVPDSIRDASLMIGERTLEYDFKSIWDRKLPELFNAESYQRSDEYREYYVWRNTAAWDTKSAETAGVVHSWGQGFKRLLLHEYAKKMNLDIDYFRPIWSPDIIENEYGGLDVIDPPLSFETIKRRYVGLFNYVEDQGGPEFTKENQFSYEPVLGLDEFFMGHYTLEKEPEFTPVKRIELTMETFEGRKTLSVDALEPGRFSPQQFEPMVEQVPLVEYNRHDDSPQNSRRSYMIHLDRLKEIEDPQRRELLSQSAYAVIKIRRGSMWFHDMGDNRDGARIFSVSTNDYFYGGEEPYPRADMIFIECLDLSDPEVVSLTYGCELLKPLPSMKVPSRYQLTSAVDGDRLVAFYQSGLTEYASVFDVSDPKNMREISRQTNSWTNGLVNWDYYDGFTTFEDGLLVNNTNHQLTFFQLDENDRISPHSRIIKPLDWGVIQAVKLKGRHVLVSDRHKAAKYAIGEAAEAVDEEAEPVYIDSLPGFQEMIKRRADRKAEEERKRQEQNQTSDEPEEGGDQ